MIHNVLGEATLIKIGLPSSNTIEQAPILAPSPIRMGPKSVAPAPNRTQLPTFGWRATPRTPNW